MTLKRPSAKITHKNAPLITMSDKKKRKTQPIGRYTPLDFSLTLVLFKFPDVESHGRRITLALFSHQKKTLVFWPGSEFTGNFTLT